MGNKILLTKDILLELKNKSTHIEGLTYGNSKTHYTNEIYEKNKHNKHLILHTTAIEIEPKEIKLHTIDLDTMEIKRNDFHEYSFRFINLEPARLEICTQK